MATVETTPHYSPDDLLAMPEGKNFELVDGNLVELNVSANSSWVAGRLHHLISGFLDQQPIGWAWPENTAYRCFPAAPDQVRKPDGSFIRRGRLPGEKFPAGFIRIAPDLAIEVGSPNDLLFELEEKVAEYLHAGVRLVWVIDPERRTVRIHRADGTIGWLTELGTLDGEDVLPGFRVPVREMFPGVAENPALASAN